MILIILLGAIFGVLLNPYFWQAFRNSKYFDMMNQDMTDMLHEGLDNDDNDNDNDKRNLLP